MDEEFDLESLVNLEQKFYDEGYAEGYAHGRTHGFIEGQALGREKGFEIWEELGFYEGFATAWSLVLKKKGRGDDDRVFHHIRLLLDMISRFPQVNPSAAPTTADTSGVEPAQIEEDDELDISKLQRQIRSRYKILCSSLGVKPHLQTASTSEETERLIDEFENMAVGLDNVGVPGIIEEVVSANGDAAQEGLVALNLRSKDSKGASTRIPVWKLDSSGAKKPVTNEDLSF